MPRLCERAPIIGAMVFMISILGARSAGAQDVTFGPPISRAHPQVLTFESPETDPVLAADSALTPPQDAAPEPTKPTNGFFSALGLNLIDDVKHLPGRNNVYWLVGGGAAALAVHPADHSINRHLLGSPVADAFFAPGKYVGATEVQISASVATYVIGRMRHQPRAQHIGMDLIEAQLLTEGIVEAAKYAVQRQRPLNPDGTRAAGYSFPSGHSAVTFATATVFQQHFGWRWAVPTFALATYVATSRLHDNVHYASDVVFGVATGVIVGRSVTWHGRNSFRLSMVGLPGGFGGGITW
jgi:membrane-associated phospholipid phosphatase